MLFKKYVKLIELNFFFFNYYLIKKNKNKFWYINLERFFFLNLYVNSKNTRQIVLKNFNYYIFKKILHLLISSKNINFYFCQLKIKGLGYKIKQISKTLLKLILNKKYYMYLYIPQFLIMKKKYKHLFLINLNKSKLNLFVYNLNKLIKKNCYQPLSYGFFESNLILNSKKTMKQFNY